MARKVQISISLTQETLVTLRRLMKELNLSRSVTIERLINHDLMTSENTTTNLPDGLLQEIQNQQEVFFAKLDNLLLEDRQEIYDLIKRINKENHPDGEETGRTEGRLED